MVFTFYLTYFTPLPSFRQFLPLSLYHITSIFKSIYQSDEQISCFSSAFSDTFVIIYVYLPGFSIAFASLMHSEALNPALANYQKSIFCLLNLKSEKLSHLPIESVDLGQLKRFLAK